jgi:putative membrane protein insertion efficiency factor
MSRPFEAQGKLKPRPPKNRPAGTDVVRRGGTWILLLFVRFYQIFLSPFFGGACKFYPSCSKYGYEAIARHGVRRGSVLAMKRLLRCRPFTKGGHDPVPDVDEVIEMHAERRGAVAREAEGKPFVKGTQGRPFATSGEGKPFANGAQGKREFAQ